MAVQLAHEAGARVIGTGRFADRDTVLDLGAHAFLDLEADRWEDTGQVDVVFDVIGGDALDRSAALERPGGTLVSVAHQPAVRPADGRAVFFRGRTRPRTPRRPRPASAGRPTAGACRRGAVAGRGSRRLRLTAARPGPHDHSR